MSPFSSSNTPTTLFFLIILILSLYGSKQLTSCSKWVSAKVPLTPFPQVMESCSEGIAASETHFYFNSRTTFWETDLLDLSVSNMRTDVLDQFNFTSLGYRHIGDIQYWEGKLILPISAYPKLSPKPMFAYMNASTFEIIENQWKGIEQQMYCPWVAIHPNSREIWSSDYSVLGVDTLNVFDEQFNYKRSLKMSSSVWLGIQGGEFFQGVLYISANALDSVFSVDVVTGKVELQELQWAIREMEGITFIDLNAYGRGEMHFFENVSKNKTLWHYQLADQQYREFPLIN